MIRLTLLLLVALTTTTASAQVIPPDITVAADGSGDFKSLHAAVQSIPKDNRERKFILIKGGVYNEKIRIDAPYVTLRGQSRDKTRIEFAQAREDFDKNRDEIGEAVVNIRGDDCVIENLTIKNTHGVVGPHAFAILGRGDRTVIIDSDLLSEGADTVALWNGREGRYYHARCHFRGAVDFVCPRGWCYIEDSTFFETKDTAALWHDGRHDKDQKFVLRNCKFDGVPNWVLARHHVDAAFYWLDCTFSNTMADRAPYRVIYPIGDKPTTQGDIDRNRELDKENRWGERAYFFNCHRDGGDYAWHADNLATAEGSPTPQQVTAKWTFAGKWDPQSTEGPKLTRREQRDGKVVLTFAEPVTVKGDRANYVSGSGTETLVFSASPDAKTMIVASQASAAPRIANISAAPKGE